MKRLMIVALTCLQTIVAHYATADEVCGEPKTVHTDIPKIIGVVRSFNYSIEEVSADGGSYRFYVIPANKDTYEALRAIKKNGKYRICVEGNTLPAMAVQPEKDREKSELFLAYAARILKNEE